MKIDQGEDDFIHRPHNFGQSNKKLFKVDYSFSPFNILLISPEIHFDHPTLQSSSKNHEEK